MPNLHQPRTFFFRPGETVTLKVTAKSTNSAGRFRALRGQRPLKASPKTLVFRMPKEGLGLSVAELDVSFGGRWDRLHLEKAGIEVSVRGSKGTTYQQRILPGPKLGRWTYRIISAPPHSVLHFCPEAKCERRMLPTIELAERGACPSCGKRRMMVALQFMA
jgi:hypothetical protein